MNGASFPLASHTLSWCQVCNDAVCHLQFYPAPTTYQAEPNKLQKARDRSRAALAAAVDRGDAPHLSLKSPTFRAAPGAARRPCYRTR